MSVGRIVGVVVLAALVVALALPRLLDRGDGPGETPAPADQTAERPLVVEVVEVRPTRLAERLTTTGTVRANEQVEVVSEVAGVVSAIHFDEGSRVQGGDLLVELVDTELQAQRDRVAYRLRLAESREARQRELLAQGVVSDQEYDVADNELNVLRAELRLVEAQLEKTRIRAPFAGMVGLRFVSRGSLVTPQTRIASLQDVSRVKIDFSVPEAHVGAVRPGQSVQFRVKGGARTRLAEVYAVEPRIDPETRSLIARATAPNDDGALLPGAFAEVTLTIAEADDALVVPSLAVVPELGGAKVFVIDDGVARPRDVSTGIRTDTDVQITKGLAPGDRVIVSAIQRLRPELPVVAAP